MNESISREEALSFERALGVDFSRLLKMACEKRNTHWGQVITYSRKVFIPLTNMCRDSCGYCVFVQGPESKHARYIEPDEVLETARKGEQLGCKEILFSLGERPELRYARARRDLNRLGYDSTIEYLHEMCKLVVSRTGLIPHANPGTMNEYELRLLKPVTGSMGMMLESASDRLLGRGEAHFRCPDKVPSRRLATIETAGRNDVPFTTGILVGIGETWEERVDALIAIGRVNEKFGHIQEVIIQNFRAKPGIAMAGHPEPEHVDLMRTIAVARLLLDPSISIQAPPNLGSRYIEYIGAGLNDWGGISPLTIDYINPERAWPQIEGLSRKTEEAGFTLRERLTVYPRYLREAGRSIDSKVGKKVLAMAGDDGLAATQFLD